MVRKRVALLGATGSIGKSTLQVIREQSDKLELVLATAHCNCDELYHAAEEFNIPTLVVTNENLKTLNHNTNGKSTFYYGEAELVRILREGNYDIALNAISGSAGLNSTMAILETGKTLALANKESLVMAGHLVKKMQAKHGSRIIPVDSEHSALFQAIGQHPHPEVARVHITASGGAFRTLPLEDFDKITVEQALKHPNWDMGFKVTLDSATMFNKALEVMEAHWLFDLDWKQISAVIHPQSVIHSMVEFVDGSILAQMSVPDMKLPILYALSYPERYPSRLVQTNVAGLPSLTFEYIDPARYPLYFLGLEAGRAGGVMPTVINAANEAALQLFMQRKIGFNEIYKVAAKALEGTVSIAHPDLETIIETNTSVYNRVINSI
jgi:1-deoxy-D-xylulose-5-phosphate reductoisomerase